MTCNAQCVRSATTGAVMLTSALSGCHPRPSVVPPTASQQALPGPVEPSGSSKPYLTSHQLSPLQQQGRNTCWAAALAMLYNWKHGTSLSEADVVAEVCPTLVLHHRHDRWLEDAEKKVLVKSEGLEFRWGQSYTCEALVDLVRAHGPIWFTTEINAHANIVYALSGSGVWDSTWVHVIDPADGRSRIEPFVDFHRRYEAAVFSANIFVVHWRGQSNGQQLNADQR